MISVRVLLWKMIKWFLFRIDAETAHHLTVRCMKVGILLGRVPLSIVSGASLKEGADSKAIPLPYVFGMEFRSKIGLAAGFDKNGEILSGLPALGFGFAEVGTVTPRPQPGNSFPRLFRNAKEHALFNRMGFNGLGAEVVSSLVTQAKEDLPLNFRVGVNIGKNKDTPIEDSHKDYVRATRAFNGIADYLVLNVSSPNTPGLRSLQTIEALKPIVKEVLGLISGWKKKPPLLLKLAPELGGQNLIDLIRALEDWGIDGWILTNTLGGKTKIGNKELEGGWSGGPLTELSRKSLIEVRQTSQKPIISVGGITSLGEAKARISAGADLIQIYTGWIYRGPSFPGELSRKLHQI